MYKILRALAGQGGVKGQYHGLIHAALGQFLQFIAESAHAAGGQLRALQVQGEVVARMRLEGQHAAGHAALLRLAAQERQHGLVAAVYAVEITNGQCAGRGEARMLVAAEKLHGFEI